MVEARLRYFGPALPTFQRVDSSASSLRIHLVPTYRCFASCRLSQASRITWKSGNAAHSRCARAGTSQEHSRTCSQTTREAALGGRRMCCLWRIYRLTYVSALGFLLLGSLMFLLALLRVLVSSSLFWLGWLDLGLPSRSSLQPSAGPLERWSCLVDMGTAAIFIQVCCVYSCCDLVCPSHFGLSLPN